MTLTEVAKLRNIEQPVSMFLFDSGDAMRLVSDLKEVTSEQANTYLHSKTSEKAAWFFGSVLFILLVVFIWLAPNPSPTQMGLIRYMTALSAAFLSFFFVGKLVVKGKFAGVAISSTSGIAVFVGMIYFSDRIFAPAPQIVETSSSIPSDTVNTGIEQDTSTGPATSPTLPDDASGSQASTPAAATQEAVEENGSADVSSAQTAPPTVVSQQTVEPTVVNLSQIACDNEPNLRSTSSTNRTTITFDNRSQGVFSVYWLDYENKRKLYINLLPTQQSTIETWDTHFWLVANVRGECTGIYQPQTTPGRVILR